LGGVGNTTPPWWNDKLDEECHILDSVANGDFETKRDTTGEAMTQYRIVIVDLHVIAQWHDGRKWWTCSKANNNDENDFAIFFAGTEEASMAKAKKLVGDAPVVRTDRKPLQRGSTWHIGPDVKEWYASAEDQTPKAYNEALRELARTL